MWLFWFILICGVLSHNVSWASNNNENVETINSFCGLDCSAFQQTDRLLSIFWAHKYKIKTWGLWEVEAKMLVSRHLSMVLHCNILVFGVNPTINTAHGGTNNEYHYQTLCREGGNRWRDVCIPEQLERTRHQMLCFIFYVFAQSFGGMVARAGQRAKAKFFGFAGITAGWNKPGSRSTSLKTQQENSRAFLALLPHSLCHYT